MDWNQVSQIATAAATLLAAGSLGAGFALYRLNRRDDHIGTFRLMLATTQANLTHLKDLVTYELARDLANTVVFSRDMDLPIRDLFAHCRPESSDGPGEDEIREYVDEHCPVITVPLDTPLVRDFQAVLTRVQSEIAPYRRSNPGLFRILSANSETLGNILRNEKEIARSEKLWKLVLSSTLNDHAEVPTLEHMKLTIADVITAMVMEHMSSSRRQIGMLNQMLDLVADQYFDQSPREVTRVGRLERSATVVPTTQTERITDDLREAEKCLKPVFGDDGKGARFHELVVAIEASAKPSEETDSDE